MQTLLIGLGGFGMNLINDIQSEIETKIITAVVAESSSLKNSNAAHKIELNDELLKKVEVLTLDFKNIIIANGLGGNSSKKLMQIVDMLEKNKKSMEVIVNKPFSWETEERNRLSESIIHKLIDKYVNIKIFGNDSVKDYFTENITMNEIFKLHHKDIGEYIIYKYLKSIEV